jgi:hypothetical protein
MYFATTAKYSRASALKWFLDIAVWRTRKDLFVTGERKWAGIAELFCIGII